MRWGLTKVSAMIAVAVLLVAGCSDKQAGTATPATTTGADNTSTGKTTSAAPTSGGAPAVKNELDASKYLPQPCSILSAATLKDLNISRPGIPDTTSAIAKSSGPFCTWHTDDEPVGRAYAVGFLTGNPNGLSDIYRGGKDAFPGYFEPTNVESYPAVFNGLTENRASGGCNITIGISKTLAFNVDIESSKDVGRQSCDLVKNLAATVIKTLKGA